MVLEIRPPPPSPAAAAAASWQRQRQRAASTGRTLPSDSATGPQRRYISSLANRSDGSHGPAVTAKHQKKKKLYAQGGGGYILYICEGKTFRGRP